MIQATRNIKPLRPKTKQSMGNSFHCNPLPLRYKYITFLMTHKLWTRQPYHQYEVNYMYIRGLIEYSG